MVRRSAAIVIGSIVLSVGLGAATASAATCTETWIGPGGSVAAPTSGDWGTAGNWSPSGIPTSGDAVCITGPGTYTVTLAPYVNAVALKVNGDTVTSLTLGSATPGHGTQTLDVSGQSSVTDVSTTTHKTFLTLSAGGSTSSSGRLILDATATGSENDSLHGGAAEFDPGVFANAGQILTQSEDSQWGTTIGTGTLTNTGQIGDISGVLTTTAATTNDGTFAVAAGAGDLLGASFTNDGAFANLGMTTMQQGATQIGWAQAGGGVTGSPVELRSGAGLVDSAGAGTFVFDHIAGKLVGTIPHGQTVIVRGEHSGGPAADTSVALGAGTAPVINRGDLILDAPGAGTLSGGTTHLTGGALENYGRLIATVEDTTWANYVGVGILNEHGGIVDVNSGVMYDSAVVTNHGTAEMSPVGTWTLSSGSAVTNKSDGTIEPDLAGASTYGKFSVEGGAAISAGGTFAPLLVEHYVPKANTEFRVISLDGGHLTGTFSSVERGFTADYAHESSSPAFVGLIYHKSSTPPPPRKKAVLHVRSIKGGRGTVTLKLQCTGSGTCATATIVVKAKHGHKTSVVARGSSRLKAGKSKTLTLKVKTKHKEKVAVTVSAGGKKLKSANVTVTAKKK